MVEESQNKGIDPSVVTNPDNAPKIKNLFYNVEVVILYLVGIMIFASIIYGGILYITAGGESDKAEKGKRVILGAVIAALIVIGSLAIYSFITNFILNGP